MKATIAALGVASCLLLASCTNSVDVPGGSGKVSTGTLTATLTVSTEHGAQLVYTDGVTKVARKIPAGDTVIVMEVNPDYLVAALAVGGTKDDDLSCEIVVGTRRRSEAATGSSAEVTCLAQPTKAELPPATGAPGARTITMVATTKDVAGVGWSTTLDRGGWSGGVGAHSVTAKSIDGSARMVVVSEGRNDVVSCKVSRDDGAVATDSGSGAAALALCRLAAG